MSAHWSITGLCECGSVVWALAAYIRQLLEGVGRGIWGKGGGGGVEREKKSNRARDREEEEWLRDETSVTEESGT